MKRLLLAAVILTGGASLTCGLRDWTAELGASSAVAHEQTLAQTLSLAQAKMRRAELIQRIREAKRLQSSLGRPSQIIEFASQILSNGPAQWPAEARERLLDELGFNWKSTGDYLVVSKDALRKVTLANATRTNRLTDTLCSVLAITPEERAAVEGLMEGLAAEYGAWTASHFQRSEPQGEVLAEYTLPPAPELGKSLQDRFAKGVASALGSERGQLLQEYAAPWMSSLRMRGDAPTTLTVKRAPTGQDWLPIELKSADGGLMRGALGAWQPFPGPFLPLFPGGWSELSQREGFALPKGFPAQSN